MKDRREREVGLLERQYSAVRHDSNIDWVIVEGVPVEGDFNRDETEVLVDIPSGYPETAPDNFWVPTGIELIGGGQPERCSPEHRTHEGEQWDRFSWHVDSGWAASEDIEDGSNLLTFMNSVEDRLGEGD